MFLPLYKHYTNSVDTFLTQDAVIFAPRFTGSHEVSATKSLEHIMEGAPVFGALICQKD